jgi:hypothetical protein
LFSWIMLVESRSSSCDSQVSKNEHWHALARQKHTAGFSATKRYLKHIHSDEHQRDDKHHQRE